jgi:hypothetical protein
MGDIQLIKLIINQKPMAKLACLNSYAFAKCTGGPPQTPHPCQGKGRVLSDDTLVVGVLACHLGAHGGGRSVPSWQLQQQWGSATRSGAVTMH